MSQSESPLRAVNANIVTPAHTERALPRLAELADHAFALAHQQAGCDLNNVPSGIFIRNRQARILYFAKYRVGPLPIKAVLYQDVHGVQIERVVVNFQTETVQCDDHPSLVMETRKIERARNEITTYIWRTSGRLQDICVARFPWQDFLKRLESNGISSGQSQACADSPFIEQPCPSCEVLTTQCILCHDVICMSWDCPVSQLIPFQSCSRDTYMVACLPCLVQNEDTIPPLGQCPKCDLWFCDKELMWCPGRPKETLNETSSNIIISRTVREHPVKPLVCSYCAQGQAMPECYNDECWSREVFNVPNPRICQSCSPAGGISCACERIWICDKCKDSPPTWMARCFKQCPRCQRAYCFRRCKYIQFCAECGRATLCADCAEEDRSAFTVDDGPEEEVKLVGVCQTDSCSKKFCERCVEERECANCDQTYCSLCLRHVECGSCWRSSELCEWCRALMERFECKDCDHCQAFCGSCIPPERCACGGSW